MAIQRKVEIFSGGCAVCSDAISLAQDIACPSCDVVVLDMNDPILANRASSLGIRSVPAAVINGKLAECCQGRGPDEGTLLAAGIGTPT